MEAMVGHLKLGQKFHLRRREPYSEEEERKIVEWILVRERLQTRNWSVGGKTVLQLCPYCFSTILWRIYNLPIFRKRDLEDHGKPGCPARQVLAKHQGAISKSYPQVKLLSFPFPSIFHLKENCERWLQLQDEWGAGEAVAHVEGLHHHQGQCCSTENAVDFLKVLYFLWGKCSQWTGESPVLLREFREALVKHK